MEIASIVGTRRASGARSYALKMTGNSAVRITVMKRPRRITSPKKIRHGSSRSCSHSHPSTHARMAAAQRTNRPPPADQP
jgi:hypothetical protein